MVSTAGARVVLWSRSATSASQKRGPADGEADEPRRRGAQPADDAGFVGAAAEDDAPRLVAPVAPCGRHYRGAVVAMRAAAATTAARCVKVAAISSCRRRPPSAP